MLILYISFNFTLLFLHAGTLRGASISCFSQLQVLVTPCMGTFYFV